MAGGGIGPGNPCVWHGPVDGGPTGRALGLCTPLASTRTCVIHDAVAPPAACDHTRASPAPAPYPPPRAIATAAAPPPSCPFAARGSMYPTPSVYPSPCRLTHPIGSL
eukprot:gene11209-9767_t